MRLEIHAHRIRGMSFGEQTTLQDGALTIDRQELSEILLSDDRIAGVTLHAAAPGEPCRIVQAWDVVEARFRTEGSNFPGIVGPIETVGFGVTHALKEMGVVITNPLSKGPEAMVIDMFGVGAEWGLYGGLHNLIIEPRPADGVGPLAFNHAIRVAQLRAAAYLGRAAHLADAPADEVEVYELPPLTRRNAASSDLPRVAYVYQIHSHQRPTVPGEPVIYGNNVQNFLPTLLHPNEVLDGAVVRSYYNKGYETYTAQNHAIIKELFARHGVDLVFVGLVVTVAHQTEPERLQGAAMAAKLVTEVLGVDGAILSKTGGGAPHIDMAQVGEYLERDGVATTLIAQEHSGDGSVEGGLLFNFPGANAIVNYGQSPAQISLPAAERLVGGTTDMLVYNQPALGALELELRVLAGAENPIGANRTVAVQY